jgi:hypothetical protein
MKIEGAASEFGFISQRHGLATLPPDYLRVMRTGSRVNWTSPTVYYLVRKGGSWFPLVHTEILLGPQTKGS